MRAPETPYQVRTTAMHKANRQGPSRSPTALSTPSPCSANNDAHWFIEISEPAAQNIMPPSTQNTGWEKRERSDVPSVRPSSMLTIGTRRNRNASQRGNNAQNQATTGQASSPSRWNSREEMPMTSTIPQQYAE
jgi:hypothetical protein